ncbi:Membrane-bound acyltransferase YfiQ, involved in biofilm formation [Paenibacillus sp. UNCCL117]|uniref:acyltransferase family protein n=1 Tax=unclassified Paenibacillus TaxID=185978 RepID=UPI00087F4285|nr:MULTISPECIES: acyltransferase family protein [unclassified Paenibacillus]SDC02089.1 Membrane-bound acyltransferase YfiQ, involved in biofilm formation [Paenibacillus sp. cl123]SFW36775.1 Membrane-bound acyltransferase YfiQ, involved in biofilm formation [Paenibacillus sp. UNCCL117]
MSKQQVNEIFLLRSLACLAIVFLHAITFSKYDSLELPAAMAQLLESGQMLLMFGTPMFIFISEFLLSYSYPNRLPSGFFTKRLKFIALPFLTMALIYALLFAISHYPGDVLRAFLIQSIRNLFFADFHGYFILIIFQFYVMHALFQKLRMERFSPALVMTVSLGITLAYLGLFNFSPPLFNEYYWKRLVPIAFPAWLAYFTAAYYCGRNYAAFKAFCASYKYAAAAVVIGFAGIMLYLNGSGVIEAVHSKRIDVLFYTFGVIILLFYLASRLKRIPTPLLVVSNYSFAIYWIHLGLQVYIMPYLIPVSSPASVFLFIPVAFALGLFGSLGIAWLLNMSGAGIYLIGRTGPSSAKPVRPEMSSPRASWPDTRS